MFKKQHTYYKKLLLILVIFSLLLTLPYTFFLYRTAKKNVEQTVYTANMQYLSQISQTFTYDRKTVSSLCLSAYFENTFKEMMYSENVDTLEATGLLKKKLTSAAILNSSIYSIGVYNSSTGKVYSTLNDYVDNALHDDSLAFFRSLESPKELMPYFRVITDGITGRPINVFTYFVFDYPADTDPSYLVINQQASWLLNSAEESSQSHPVATDFFIYGKGKGLCSSNSALSQDFIDSLLTEFEKVHSTHTEQSDTFTLTVNGTKYSAAYWNLGTTTDCIILLQEYHALYSGLTQLRNFFWVILILCCIFMTFAVLFVSRQLYKPIASLAAYINNSSHNAYVSPKVNEFEQFREIYQQTSTALSEQDRFKKTHLQHIQMERILLDETDASCALFKEFFPSHWLNTNPKLPLCCISATLDESNDFGTQENIRLHVYALQNILSELLEKECYVEAFQTQSNDVICVIGCKTVSVDIKSILAECASYIDEYFSFSIFSCFSDTVFSLEQLHKAYEEVKVLKQYYPIFGPGSIVYPQKVILNLANDNMDFPVQTVQTLIAAIRERNQAETANKLQALCQYCKTMNVEYIQGAVFSLLSKVNYVLKENHVVSQMMSVGKISELNCQLTNYPTVDALFSDVSTQISDILGLLMPTATEKNQKFVEQIYEYIALNYSDYNLSSQTIADHLGYSAKHVMKKFKELTGTSLVDYILSVRMEQAAQLLLHTQHPIAAIGKQVGIESNSYFYKLFKNTYGCTPKEYIAASRSNTVSTQEDAKDG